MIWGITLVTIQLLLALYIVSNLYSFVTIKLKTLNPINHKNSKCFAQTDIAAIFIEELLSEEIRNLVTKIKDQNYKHLVSYIFIDEKIDITEFQKVENLVFIKAKISNLSIHRVIKLAQVFFIRNHKSIAVFAQSDKFNDNYFYELNTFFNKGYDLIQGQLQIKNINLTSGSFLANINARLNNKWDLYRRSFWNMGFAIKTELFNSLKFEKNGIKESVNPYSFSLLQNKELASCINNPENTSTIIGENRNSDFGTLNRKYFSYYTMAIKSIIHSFRNPGKRLLYFGKNFMRIPMLVLIVCAITLALLDYFFMPAMFGFMIISGVGIILWIVLRMFEEFAEAMRLRSVRILEI